MKKILNGIDQLINHPIYQLTVSISLIAVSIYDMVHVVVKDFIHLRLHKDHFIILIGVLMLINALNTLFKGIRGIEKDIEEEEEHTTTSAK
ncbi:hypothetical protein [Microscilla marina]|uniref:Uncharacterized protein n=1 Tax=Microscilla marina ATCC 23134 TaxID=313606 RepID=A1ZG94_MICM2|nr:hypothetical protein [Microscilla marina]EAY30511.1 hypothetical protein M23134_03147 [Microscilla marina ATCC 23134]